MSNDSEQIVATINGLNDWYTHTFKIAGWMILAKHRSQQDPNVTDNERYDTKVKSYIGGISRLQKHLNKRLQNPNGTIQRDYPIMEANLTVLMNFINQVNPSDLSVNLSDIGNELVCKKKTLHDLQCWYKHMFEKYGWMILKSKNLQTKQMTPELQSLCQQKLSLYGQTLQSLLQTLNYRRNNCPGEGCSDLDPENVKQDLDSMMKNVSILISCYNMHIASVSRSSVTSVPRSPVASVPRSSVTSVPRSPVASVPSTVNLVSLFGTPAQITSAPRRSPRRSSTLSSPASATMSLPPRSDDSESRTPTGEGFVNVVTGAITNGVANLLGLSPTSDDVSELTPTARPSSVRPSRRSTTLSATSDNTVGPLTSLSATSLDVSELPPTARRSTARPLTARPLTSLSATSDNTVGPLTSLSATSVNESELPPTARRSPRSQPRSPRSQPRSQPLNVSATSPMQSAMPEENLSAMPEENLSATSTFSPMSVPKAPTPQQMDAPMSAAMLDRRVSAPRALTQPMSAPRALTQPMSAPRALTQPMSAPRALTQPMSAPRMEDESMLNRQVSAPRSESLVGGSESSANYRLIANLFN